ncbi:MAG: BatD family protein [Cytophagales bacterium]|nr:BatD family protein [Cytophagales bacterium]
MIGRRILILITFLFGFCAKNLGQNIRIVLGPDKIALNQAFTITVEVQNGRIKSIDNFPEIPGFNRVGQQTSSSTNIINGQYSSTYSIIQNYIPLREGTIVIKPFTMVVNDQPIKSPGKSVTVGPEVQQQRRYDPFSYDPFEEFFGRRQPQEYIDVKEDAFLALTVDKEEVYVGEGFTVTLGLFVSSTNQATLDWPNDISEQLAEIKKEITPSNCWEENFKITNLNRESVEINNKRYGHYKLFQASFFPLNNEPITFPSIPLSMIKYKVAKNPSFFGRSKQADTKVFRTKPKKVTIKELPPHPLKDQVPVGKYQLSEEISSERLNTGQSFTYQFAVHGEGNISAIDNPDVIESEDFEFYPPNIRQNINRSNNKVRGSKSFNYYAIPNEPGAYDLKDYISLVYFDPYTERYDTLQSNARVVVTGESKKNVSISSNDLGSFYNVIEIENNQLEHISKGGFVKVIANILILILLALTIYFMIRK